MFAAALSARAQQFEFDADHTETDRNESIATGHARFSQSGLVVTADEVRVLNDHSVATARGHVVVTRNDFRLLADRLIYHPGDGTFTADRVRLGLFPYYVEGATASGTVTEITVAQATFTYGEPGPWQPTLKASKLVYDTVHKRVHSENSQAGLGQAQFLPFPKITQDLRAPLLSLVSLTGGFRRTLGAFADAGVHLPAAPGVMLGGDVAFYTARGLMFGPSGSYARGDELNGYFRSGFINDHGDKKTDILGRPVPENRGYVEWQHAQKISDELTVAAQLNWWKDSEVLRDFRPKAFFPVQEPDTFVESAYAGKNYFVSLFARFQPNSFNPVQERLPEVRFDLLPVAVGGGFVERFNASAAVLREDPLPLGPTNLTSIGQRRSNRLDAYYALERPIAPTEWFAFTPVVGARVTHYSDAHTTTADLPINPAALTPTASFSVPLGDYTRTLGEFGFDAALRTSGTFDYKNTAWGINGLRHLFTPRVSYRYIPEGDRGRGKIPMIDRQVFSTYLQPLGLANTRNLDDLHATNILRLGLDNTVQTRDENYGSRDLFTANFAADFKFKHARTERDVSDVHTELAFAPAGWLQVDAYSRLTPQTLTLQEFNSGVTLHDGDAWSVRFSNNFLRREIEDYIVDGRLRLNERYDALTRLHYDARKRRFNEQAYGLVQNLDNTWRVSYIVSLYSGPRRESHFGLNVQIEARGF